MVKNYATVNPERGFKYTFAIVDETIRDVLSRGYANQKGIEELLVKYAKTDETMTIYILNKLTRDRYLEYTASLSGGHKVSLYLSFLADPRKFKSPLEELEELEVQDEP